MTTRFARTGRRCARNPTIHGPAHLNKFAFRHNPNSAKTKAIAKIPHRRVCARCFDILEWKKAFRKYKPSKHPRRCDECSDHSIITSYHVICESCSIKLGCCAKCKMVFDDRNPMKESETSTMHTPDQVESALAGFKERNRRSMTRAIENGVFTLEEVLKMCDPVGNLQQDYVRTRQQSVEADCSETDSGSCHQDQEVGDECQGLEQDTEGDNNSEIGNPDHPNDDDSDEDYPSSAHGSAEFDIPMSTLELIDR